MKGFAFAGQVLWFQPSPLSPLHKGEGNAGIAQAGLLDSGRGTRVSCKVSGWTHEFVRTYTESTKTRTARNSEGIAA